MQQGNEGHLARELQRAYRRPSDAEVEASLGRVTTRAVAESRWGPNRILRVAAIVMALAGAFAAGFATSERLREPQSPAGAIVQTGDEAFVVRPPVLVTQPRS